ncbi:hypothetical protein [Rhodococcus xishaensis]
MLVAPSALAQSSEAVDTSDRGMCAWRFMSDGEVGNIAFPDTNATYWVLPYALGPETSIELSGNYPAARYFSLNTYGTGLDTIDTLRDALISPDAGSSNPFSDSPAENLSPDERQWTATLVPGPADHARNEIQALRPGGSPVGFLIYRVYVPDDAASQSGGVPLPEVRYNIRGNEVPIQPCAEPFGYQPSEGSGLMTGLRPEGRPSLLDSLLGNAPEATFANPERTAGLFPNGDNKYISAQLTYEPGRIAVVRGKAPAFPNTSAGDSPIDPDQQLRYWSMCQNDLVLPFPVVACAGDFETALDAEGWYTYVVAAPEDVPSKADPTVTVLPWGSTDIERKVLIWRNMLPTDTFYPLSIQAAQAEGADPAATMGEYYPSVTYCSAETFDNEGYAGCFQ